MSQRLISRWWLVGLLALCCGAAPRTFTNPLLPSGADPWTIAKDGWYFYTHTTGRDLTIWKTRNIADLAHAQKKVVWRPPAAGPYSQNIWAPELHFLDGKWYLYFAADDGKNENHRLYVLENEGPDPLAGTWVMKGQLHTPEDRWSIDGSVFEYGGSRYLLWSGWPSDHDGEQDVYLCRLRNAWTAEGRRTRISSPTDTWERVGDSSQGHIGVNEGPEALIHNGRVFVVYSGNGCWTDNYALGLIFADKGKDLLDAAAWHKYAGPVFRQGNSAVYAPGHNAFFRSPDGTEDWILYHANAAAGKGCAGERSPRAQRFRWKPDGFPDFGVPIAPGKAVRVPSERLESRANGRAGRRRPAHPSR